MSEALIEGKSIGPWLPVIDPETMQSAELDVRTIIVDGSTMLDLRDLEAALHEVRANREIEQKGVLNFDCGLSIDPRLKQVSINGRPLSHDLSVTEYRIAEVLLYEKDRLHPREEMLSRLWRGKAVDAHVIDVHFSTLKGKLGAKSGKKGVEAGPNAGLLINRPGFGFMVGPRLLQDKPLIHPDDIA